MIAARAAAVAPARKTAVAHRAFDGDVSGVRSALEHNPPARRRCACGGSCPRCVGSAGQALPAGLRDRMEAQLSTPLSDVRIYTDTAAAAAAAAERAHAFTLGTDIFFGAGRFAPHTTEGYTRLAHELAHVEQQRRGRRGIGLSDARSAEREARSLGALVAVGQRVSVRTAAPHAVQRDGTDDTGPAPNLRSPAGPRLQLDPEIERLMLQQYIRWWLGTALTVGDAPTSVPAPGSADLFSPTPPLAAPGAGLNAGGLSTPPLLPNFPLKPDFFSPLPPDSRFLEPDVGALFSSFGERNAPVGAGDSQIVFDIYRRNEILARGLPDLRSMAPRFIQPLIPLTWRRDIAGALTSAAVGSVLKRDYMTPIEVSDRAFEGMTGASTTVIPLPSISFDLFGGK